MRSGGNNRSGRSLTLSQKAMTRRNILRAAGLGNQLSLRRQDLSSNGLRIMVTARIIHYNARERLMPG